MKFRMLIVLMMPLISYQVNGTDCSEFLDSEKCHPTGVTSLCTLLFPSYDDECFDWASLQTKDLNTSYHWPESLDPGDWGLENIHPAPPNVVTVCGQFRECAFEEGMGGAPDACVPGSGPWHTYWDEPAYDFGAVCQSPE
jgi:hypothetical protein